MNRSIACTVFVLSLVTMAAAQIKAPAIAATHPRFMINGKSKAQIRNRIDTNAHAGNQYRQVVQNIDSYVNRHQVDTTWIISRLQLYWKTRSTDVFIKGGVYDHAEGEAPVPTVRFPGTRDNVTVYAAPKLEDIPPYLDDPKGLYLVNRTKDGQPMEWAEISKTGRIVESINTQIMGMAYDAAVLYWLSGEQKYARFAFDLFDTYMTGMYYRKEPVDLTHGHHQTLVGLSTFEVIQEVAILNHLTGIYDFIYDYLQQKAPGKMTVYTSVFKKWADIQIAHGVAFNNWNLMEARNVLNIALVLDDDKNYNDGKGNQYYTGYILNTSSQRQWSLQKIVREGYDSVTGLWNECPGYSMGVLNDFIGFVSFFDTYYNIDLVEKMPVLLKAVTGVAQYLFPNGYYAAFGDSHYGRLNLSAAYRMVVNARKNKKPKQEELFTRYIKAVQQFCSTERNADRRERPVNTLLFSEENIQLNEQIASGNITEYVTPVLSSPHVSYFALRNGLDPQNGLMVAMSGSKGNHMHAGGIAMEIYGKGYVLGPESGIGTSYFQTDYAEYYSKFPAHNTVAVDGISAYPVMKSNHAFEVQHLYPGSGLANNYFPFVHFGDLYFLEPETNADQQRLISIIRTSDSTGYYVDVFRSRRRNGKDKMHDYFYHNMGQQLQVVDNKGLSLPLQPTDELSFGGGHMGAYDYFYDKQSVTTDKDINAIFSLSIPGKDTVQMHMWMKGSTDRAIFAVKSPPSKAIDRMGLPAGIAELPMPTIVARQTGEAWKRPFVTVFEPAVASHRSIKSITSIGSDGIIVENTSGSRQTIFYTNGTYSVISETKGELQYLFLGNGRTISKAGYQITAKEGNVTAALCKKNNEWFFTSSGPVTLTHNKRVIDLPAMPYTKIKF
jgi:hypothetical protein